MAKPALLYITEGYPFKHAEVFPGDELPFLLEQDWDLFLLPGERPFADPISTPPQVTVRTDLICTRRQRWKRLLRLNALQLVYAEYQSQRAHSVIPPLRRAIGEISVALYARHVLRAFMIEQGLRNRPVVIYNFWCIPTAFGACLLRREFPHIRIVARALGGDIYPEQNPASYIPFRFLRVSQFDVIAPCSVQGYNFLRQEGFAEGSVTVVRLGVPDAPGIAPSSPSGCLALVSCSSFVPVKRLPLFIDNLRALALAVPSTRFSWDHLGSRENRPALLALAEAKLGDLANCSYTVHEEMPLAAVRAFFASKPLDALVNVSFSEGLPVSMMEATACGLPILGTDVGGVREIVTPQTGILLPMDFTSEQFIEGASRLNEWKHGELRMAIARFSKTHFSASRNYRTFIEQVIKPAMQSSSDALERA